MIIKHGTWKNLFLLCGGLFLGTAFCMKWMEKDFLFEGRLFTIVGLEAIYPREKLSAILGGIEDPVRDILRYHLYFDFAFMAGVYPGIAALCMMAAHRCSSSKWKRVLGGLAIAQTLAWACDIAENVYLLRWIDEPAQVSAVGRFHLIVMIKWGLALLAAALAIPLNLFSKPPAARS